MATTEEGIYYPDDYTKNADVPDDMKKMAKSIDVILKNKVNKIEGKGLSTEDYTTEEKSKLAGLTNYNDTAIKKEIQELDDNQIHVTTEKAENINVQDSSGQNGKIKLFGISKQEGTPSPEYPSEIENVTGDIDITVCNKNLLKQELELYDGNYDNSGNYSSNKDKRINDYIFLKKGNYIISANNNNWINLLVYDIDKNLLSITNSSVDKKLSFSLEEDGYIRFGFNPVVASLKDMQIEKRNNKHRDNSTRTTSNNLSACRKSKIV